jgi:hypothetical protein
MALDSTRTPETFHPFPNLPIELRAKIWKFFLSQTPAIITVCYRCDFGFHSPDHEGGPLLSNEFFSVKYHLFKHTKKLMLTPHFLPAQIHSNMTDEELELAGYVELPSALPRCGVWFNPEVDILSLSRHKGYQCRTKKLKNSLAQCNALHKVKAIAVDATQHDLWLMIESLKLYTSLELIFFVTRTRTMRDREIRTGTARKPLDKFFFSGEAIDVDEYSPYRVPDKGTRQRIYKALARGQNGLTPHVFFVKAREDLIPQVI